MNAIVEECHLKKGPGYDYKLIEINGAYKKKLEKEILMMNIKIKLFVNF